MGVIERSGVRIVACGEAIARVDDALNLIAACLENDAQRVLIDEQYLPADFFDLRTRFAGEFLQKFVNYRMRVAAFLASPAARSERFGEFLREASRGRDFRAFASRDEAEAWLASG